MSAIEGKSAGVAGRVCMLKRTSRLDTGEGMGRKG